MGREWIVSLESVDMTHCCRIVRVAEIISLRPLVFPDCACKYDGVESLKCDDRVQWVKPRP